MHIYKQYVHQRTGCLYGSQELELVLTVKDRLLNYTATIVAPGPCIQSWTKGDPLTGERGEKISSCSMELGNSCPACVSCEASPWTRKTGRLGPVVGLRVVALWSCTLHRSSAHDRAST